MPNDPAWPALMVSRDTKWRTKLTVGAAVGTVTNHPANVHGLYSALGIGAGAPLNSLAVYDNLGNPLDFEVEQFDGTNIAVHWQDDFASADADRYLYWDPTVDPGSSLANATGTWDANFKDVWHMGEASGAIYDSTINDNDASVVDLVDYSQTGQMGNCLRFNGTATTPGYLQGADSDSLDATTALSISAWLYRVAVPNAYFPFVFHKEVYNASGYNFGCISSSNDLLALRIDGDNARTVVETAATYGEWVHYVVTYDGTTLKLYKNGVLNNSTGSVGSIAANAVDPRIGKYFNGSIIDEMRVATNVARSAAWILAETLFGLGTAVTVGAVEEYAAAAAYGGPVSFVDMTARRRHTNATAGVAHANVTNRMSYRRV